MPVVCWGALAKSASDNTTIPEYIASKILEHNVDASAHGLDSYAIYNHRVDPTFDHPDYAITSDKISAYQIIGKHFVTDYNVGPSVDGIEFDKNAISMWYQAARKVYIPKTGNPEFAGDVTLNSLSYLRNLVALTFEGIDGYQTLGNNVSVGSGGGSLLASVAVGYIQRLMTRENTLSVLDWAKNPGFFSDLQLYYQQAFHHICYWGMGGRDDDAGYSFLGFMCVNNVLYALHHALESPSEVKTVLTGYNPRVRHKYQAFLRTGYFADFLIDDVLVARHSHYLPFSRDEDSGHRFYIYLEWQSGYLGTQLDWQNVIVVQDS